MLLRAKTKHRVEVILLTPRQWHGDRIRGGLRWGSSRRSALASLGHATLGPSSHSGALPAKSPSKASGSQPARFGRAGHGFSAAACQHNICSDQPPDLGSSCCTLFSSGVKVLLAESKLQERRELRMDNVQAILWSSVKQWDEERRDGAVPTETLKNVLPSTSAIKSS